MTRRHPNVINVDETEVRAMKKGRHDMGLRRLGGPALAKHLGAIHTTLPPGAISFPMHAHWANEEAIFIISGKGTARIGDARIPVRPGDWITLLAGPEHAHQMVNDSDTPLVYICVSTMNLPEVVSYPESNRLIASGPDPTSPMGFKRIGAFRMKDNVDDYWDGEPEAG